MSPIASSRTPPQRLGRDVIAALIPHAGRMCLLDEVTSWDDEHIVSQSRAHLRADNPLRDHGRLDTVHALEFGAQAAAVHGALLSSGHGRGALQQQAGAPAGRIAAFRGVTVHRSRLDDLHTALDVVARRCAAGTSGGFAEQYSLAVSAGGDLLLSGRATIAFVSPGMDVGPGVSCGGRDA